LAFGGWVAVIKIVIALKAVLERLYLAVAWLTKLLDCRKSISLLSMMFWLGVVVGLWTNCFNSQKTDLKPKPKFSNKSQIHLILNRSFLRLILGFSSKSLHIVLMQIKCQIS
jgi:hypothetical protein